MKSKIKHISKYAYKLTDINSLCSFVYGKGLPKKHRNENGDIPVYGSNGIIGYHDISLTTGPTIIIGRKGTIGAVHFSKKPCWPIDTAFFIQKTENSMLKFVYYLLKNLDLEHMNSDSAVPGLNRNRTHQIKVKIPPLQKQQKISKILSDLDSKIENLQKQNKILEQIAQTVFKSWFVDYEFPDGNGKPYKSSGGEMVYSKKLGKKIPKGWNVEGLDKNIIFINGLPLQKFRPTMDKYLPVIKIREMKNGLTSNTEKARVDLEKKYVVENGDILFSWSGTLELMMWYYGKGALNQHIFKVVSEQYEKWFCYEWILFHLSRFRRIAAGKVTTMGHIQRHHLSEVLVIVPSLGTLKKMNDVMNPIFDKLISNNIAIQKLIQIRNSLLPKLMSGEIRV